MIDRRDFLKLAGAAAVFGLPVGNGAPERRAEPTCDEVTFRGVPFKFQPSLDCEEPVYLIPIWRNYADCYEHRKIYARYETLAAMKKMGSKSMRGFVA